MRTIQAQVRQVFPYIALALLSAIGPAPAGAQTISYFETGEEFAGPFPSWKNVRTDFGAKGDGVADDAPAISAALDALDGTASVLYFPAGTYLINSTVLNTKRTGTMTIVGEDPATTSIVCGEDFTSLALGAGAMFRLDGTYGNISRLSFDGKGKAEVGLLRDGGYGTDWRITDLHVKNVGVGIQWGRWGGLGQDLSSMMRCRFTNCGTGILATGQNCLGPYAWYCLFEDCNVGIDSGGGFVQPAECVFLRSKVSDISRGQHGYMILNNTSIGSKCFLGSTGAPMTTCLALGNRIYNTLDPLAMQGVNVMLDNVIRSRTTIGPALNMTRANTMLVGNTFTVEQPVATSGRYFIADQKIVDPATLPVPTTLRLPGVPENRHRKVFEVRPDTGDDAKEIQQQIDAAAQEPDDTNPVIHIPGGAYRLSRTIVLPARETMQLVGDGGRGVVTISWGGTGTGPLFLMHGPSRVTMREMHLVGGGADAIHMDSCDQIGGRLYCDQVDLIGNYGDGTNGADTHFLIDGVENSDVTVINHYIGGAKKGVVVNGGPVLAAGGATKGQISFLMGLVWGHYNSTFLNIHNGGRLLFCGYRAENVQKGLVTLDATSSGALTWACNNDGIQEYNTTPFVVNGFRGTLCTVANMQWVFKKVTAPIYSISGDGSECQVLSMCNALPGGDDPTVPVDRIWEDTSDPPASALMALNQANFNVFDWQDLPTVDRKEVDAEQIDTQVVLDCLQQLRALRIEPPTNRAPGVTDIKLIRLPIDVGRDRNGIIMRAAVGQ